MKRNFLISFFRGFCQVLWNEKEKIDLSKVRLEPKILDKWIHALYFYKLEIRDAIWQLKYQRNKEVARFFGLELAKYLIENFKDEKSTPKILIPIPIHWRRRIDRGFNQTEWLCQEIMKNLDQFWPNHDFIYSKNILKRIKYRQKQSWISHDERAKNLAGVFNAKKFPNAEKFKIILIDDVVTSGATLCEARKCLNAVGAQKIEAVVVGYAK